MRSHVLRIAATLAVALVCATTSASAQVALKNIALTASRNDYPAVGGWGYSACWGYVHPDGREYAVLGTTNGTAIYNVTDPNNVTFVKFIPGLSSSWREMKSYRTWIYVVTESATPAGGINPGLQIIRMTDPQNPVLAATYGVNFNRSHTIQIDTTRAVLLCNGTNFYNTTTGTTTRTGMRILSLQPNPEAPVEIGSWPAPALMPDISYYIHDCVVFGNRLYASSIYSGTERIFDFSTPSNPVEIKHWTYPSAYYTHSSWPDDARDRLYVCDEQNGQTLRVFDISSETAPTLVNQWTSNAQAIAHNPRVKGTDLWIANYTEGIRALDIYDPTHPVEWGYADSYPGASGGYNGVWEVYPYFPSGTVIASDMNTGLYVYRADKNVGVVYATVKAGVAPLGDAMLYVAETGDSVRTSIDGVAPLVEAPGTYTLLVKKFGYQDVSTNVTLNRGDHVSLDVPMIAKPSGTFSGTVIDAVSKLPLADAEVDLRYTPAQSLTNSAGSFDLGSIPLGSYRLEVRRPGYIPLSFIRNIGQSAQTETFQLMDAQYYDPLTTDAGWTVGSAEDAATSGVWVRVEPFGTAIGAPISGVDADACGCGAGCSCTTLGLRASGFSASSCCGGSCGSRGSQAMATPIGCNAVKSERAQLRAGHDMAMDDEALYPPPAGSLSTAQASHALSGLGIPSPGDGVNTFTTIVPVQPENDRSPAPDSLCWVTGQGTIHNAIDEADVDGGKTTLTSPAYDATGMADPTIGFWQWFYTQLGSADDWLAILISNDDGATWMPVDTVRGLHNQWEEQAIHVASYVTPTTHVRLRFAAADMGEGSVVEAGIDDISVYDGAIPIVGTPDNGTPSRFAFRSPAPNPSQGAVTLALELPRPGRVQVEVLDLHGRRVATLYDAGAPAGTMRMSWNGADAGGGAAPPGLYFARARLDGESTSTRIVRLQRAPVMPLSASGSAAVAR